MSKKLVLLDCCTLGVLTHSNDDLPEVIKMREWATNLKRKGVQIRIPAIAKYELRRQLIRLDFGVTLANLNTAIATYGYLELTDEALEIAAEFWARAKRDHGQNLHCMYKIDADMILCGQAQVEQNKGYEAIVATDNLRDMRLVWPNSHIWEDIKP